MVCNEVRGLRWGRLYGYAPMTFLVMMMIMVSTPRCHAQTWGEFFRQKKTQKKYLLEQIVALQVYIDYAKKGYKIVDGGISAIRDITNGEFRLHDLFISSLKQVSPVIRNDARIAEIVLLQVSILKAFAGVKNSSLLSADNLTYVAMVSDAVARSCYSDLEELLLVITSGKLEMMDDERLVRLDRIYKSMLDKSAFVQHFVRNTDQLIQQRRNEQYSLEAIIKMFYHKE